MHTRPIDVLLLLIVASIVGAAAWAVHSAALTPEELRAFDEAAPTVDWSLVHDAPDRPMALSWMGVPWRPGGEEGSYMERQLEQEFHVDIKPIFLDSNAYPVPPLWRGDWLERVGIHTVPQTLDELEHAFERFRYGDPDGNGRDDTYGLTTDMTLWFLQFDEIYGAFGVLPYDWMERDGRIVYGGVLPEARQALGLLRDWYAKGLIDPEFITDRASDDGSIEQKFISGKIGYMSHAADYRRKLDPQVPKSLPILIGKVHPGARIVVGAFPAGPDGLRGGRSWGGVGHVIVFGRQVQDDPAKVIRVLTMMDRMVTDRDLYRRTSRGQFGEHWQ